MKAAALLLVACFLSSCSVRSSGASDDFQGCDVPPMPTPAETTLEWGLAAMVGAGLLMVVAGVVLLFLANSLRGYGVNISRKGLALSIAVGIGLTATALALEVVIMPLVWTAVAALACAVAYGVWKLWGMIRAAHEADPPTQVLERKR